MRLDKAVNRCLKKEGLRPLLGKGDEIFKEWSIIVGDEIAAMTKVSRLSKGVLTVDVLSSALLCELKNFFNDSLVEKISSHLKIPVHTIKFRLAGVGEIKAEFSEGREDSK